MEAFQIVFNLAFLGVLAWWVLREKKREVSREEFESLALLYEDRTNITEITANGFREYREAIEELQGIVKTMQDKRSTGGEIAEAIKAGAAMTQVHMESGAKLVLDALARDGRVAPANYEPPKEAVNLDEDQYSQYQGQEFPDLIIARNEKHAEQIGDKILDDLMRGIK